MLDYNERNYHILHQQIIINKLITFLFLPSNISLFVHHFDMLHIDMHMY